MEELVRPIGSEAVEPEDLALEAILALRELWDSARGGRRGVTLRALGLEVAEQRRYLSAVCPAHGRFHLLWTDSPVADRPQRIECPGRWIAACQAQCAVDFTYEPARPRD